jgi:hypothetical protein
MQFDRSGENDDTGVEERITELGQKSSQLTFWKYRHQRTLR